MSRAPWKLSDPSSWPQLDHVVVTDHAMERAVERLPSSAGDEQDRYRWMERTVRRASQQRAMSVAPPGWAHYRGLGHPGLGKAWVVAACDEMPVMMLVHRTWNPEAGRMVLVIITLVTPGVVNVDELLEAAS